MRFVSKAMLIVVLLAVSGCAAGGESWSHDSYSMNHGPVGILGPTGGIF